MKHGVSITANMLTHERALIDTGLITITRPPEDVGNIVIYPDESPPSGYGVSKTTTPPSGVGRRICIVDL